ncbi:hypothetical protein [Treponema sp.]|uniref:hypothetical protein n=1 Tax=Treponema sp. TaxID=166 RepID=UPI00388ED8BF
MLFKKTFLLISVVFIFFSCSQNVQESSVNDEASTLRYEAEELYNKFVWTEEIELDRLTAKVSNVKGISSKLNLSPLIVSACNTSDEDKIFPVFGSFGSLDTSLISKSLRNMLISFAEIISKNGDADIFFVKDGLYSLALFYSDFNKIFADGINFDSFLLGQPFIDGIYYEVPIQFITEKAEMTISVYCFSENGNWKIDQIQMTDWEIFNEKK